MTNQNQNKCLITKLGWGVFFSTITLNFSPLTLNSKVQTLSLSSVENNKFSHQLSQVYPQLITRRKNTESEPEPEPEPIDFSSLGRSGQQTAGESRGSCPQSKLPLTAIAPKSNESKTIASHPRWWFYLPYQKSQISKVEFVLQDNDRNDLLREDITASIKIPYFSTTIPQTYPGIQPSFWYRWYLKVYCSGGEDIVPLYVSGWVQRVILHNQAHTLEQKASLTLTEYTQQNLWLDAVDLLLRTQISKSQASTWNRDWYKIIDSAEINLELPIPDVAKIRIQ